MDITKGQIEGLLTSSCPSFANAESFRKWREEWADATDTPYYVLASDFVRHLTHLNALKQHDEFPGVFAMIEDLHLHGDSYVTEWATVGFLEDLQNRNLHPLDSEPADFLMYLAPESKKWWEKINSFWNGEV
jgi:hypothetical protein